jgi:hypothetical protein
MLLARIGSYLKSVLKYKYLILDTCHPDTKHLREQGREDPWLFSEAKMGPRAKMVGKRGPRALITDCESKPDKQKELYRKYLILFVACF